MEVLLNFTKCSEKLPKPNIKLILYAKMFKETEYTLFPGMYLCTDDIIGYEWKINLFQYSIIDSDTLMGPFDVKAWTYKPDFSLLL